MRATALAAALSMLVTGCAANVRLGPGSGAGLDGAVGLEAGDYPTQRIIRARYQGPAGQGSFRLVLRLAAEDHHQVSASDLLGRSLWALEIDGPLVRFVDFKNQRGCRADERVELQGAALGIPLQELAAVLLGRLPAGLRELSQAAESPRFRDGRGRLWTLSREESGTVGWTLWEKEEPLVWLRYQDGSGVLSHRQGSQLRWRQSLVEELQSLGPLEMPAEFSLVDCSEIGLTESGLLAAVGQN